MMPAAPAHAIIKLSPDQPLQLDQLLQAATVEGVRNMAILAEQWATGANRFQRTGEALFGSMMDGALMAVGGISVEPHHPAGLRVRRFYVHPDQRRLGLGRAVAQAVIAHGLTTTSTITCNARASAAAAPFWESLGFTPVEHPSWTHLLDVERARPPTLPPGPQRHGN